VDENLTLEDRVIAALRRIIRAVDLHSRHLVDEVGLTGPQLVALKEAARLGPTPISALARSVHVSHPTMTGIIDRLEKRGLVLRCRDEKDRRKISVTVTHLGQELLARAPSPLQDRFRAELTKLEEWERNLMLANLQRIAALMDADRLEASPVLAPGAAVASPAAEDDDVQAAKQTEVHAPEVD
jgi:DNA-binding MarR family transcriptional regulator